MATFDYAPFTTSKPAMLGQIPVFDGIEVHFLSVYQYFFMFLTSSTTFCRLESWLKCPRPSTLPLP